MKLLLNRALSLTLPPAKTNLERLLLCRRLYIAPPMPDNYFARYLPLLMHFAIATGLASAIVILSYFIGQHKPNRAKVSPYECGVQPIGDAQGRFSIKFYLVAMLLYCSTWKRFSFTPGRSFCAN